MESEQRAFYILEGWPFIFWRGGLFMFWRGGLFYFEEVAFYILGSDFLYFGEVFFFIFWISGRMCKNMLNCTHKSLG